MLLPHAPSFLSCFQEISSILKELRRVQKQLEGGCAAGQALELLAGGGRAGRGLAAGGP